MKGNIERELILKEFQVVKNQLFCLFRSENMQSGSSSYQAEGGYQSKKTKDVITVQMTDKYMVDFTETDSEFPQLHLRSLSAINQKKPLICI
jgi:hypothetical protein